MVHREGFFFSFDLPTQLLLILMNFIELLTFLHFDNDEVFFIWSPGIISVKFVRNQNMKITTRPVQYFYLFCPHSVVSHMTILTLPLQLRIRIFCRYFIFLTSYISIKKELNGLNWFGRFKSFHREWQILLTSITRVRLCCWTLCRAAFPPPSCVVVCDWLILQQQTTMDQQQANTQLGGE